MPKDKPVSLIDILRWRSKNQPYRLAYRFLVDGEYDEVVLTYEELDRRARSIAALLQSSTVVGDRALLLFLPGLDFIAAYFGCLYAKIIAIPAYPPHPARLERTVPMIHSIVKDAAPAATLLTSSLYDVIKSRRAVIAEFDKSMKWLITDPDELGDWDEKWQPTKIDGNDIAFLQYTSGSTMAPKGVIVKHNNLLHNLAFIEKSFGQSSESHTVIWLPPYHDMGLIGGILQPLFAGFPSTLIPHLTFLQRPYRWLHTISRFHATTSAGPNFAYDLCVRKIKPEQRELLDLSSWEIAVNGAEHIYHKTLDQFAHYFAPCGFSRKAFLPCYGLAEATLMVSGGPKARLPVIQNLISSELEQDRVIISPNTVEGTRTLVSCGQNMSDQKIRIVNVETLVPCLADQVGEIWVSGTSVASGYWNNPSETELTFGARLSPNEEGLFLRTGDLGFLNNGELYITGRIKDLIISDGNNHYPHDIEKTVEISHPAIRPGGCAAFSVINSGRENLVIIAEIEHKFVDQAEEVVRTVRRAIAVHHELHADDIRLTKVGNIPKTTSGKIKHYLCKEYYLAGNLNEIVIT